MSGHGDLLAARHADPASMRRPRDPARRRLDAVLIAVALLAGLVIVGVAAHIVPPPTRTGGQHHVDVKPATPTPSHVSVPPRPRGEHVHTSLAVTFIGLAAGIALLALIGVALMFLVRSAPRWPRLWSERRRSGELIDDNGRLVDDVRTAVEQGLAALEEGEVGDVIVGCWMQLTRVADRAGVALPASDTPEQTVSRIVAGTGARAAPSRALADLYREARFSRHRMGESQRSAARAAFAAVADDLGRAGRGFLAPDDAVGPHGPAGGAS